MINRDNFEMFCMRSADGELSPSEMEALQTFLAVHPDLKAEWEVWQQLKLPVAAAYMPGKEFLLKKEPIPLTEEQAWLFIDGELSPEEQNTVRDLIENNSGATQLVKDLRQYVVEAPAIICPHKEGLLRAEKTPRVIRIQRVARFSAAALIVGLIIQFALSPNQTVSDKAGSVEKNNLVNQETNHSGSLNPINANENSESIDVTAAIADQAVQIVPVVKESVSMTVPGTGIKGVETSVTPEETTTLVPTVTPPPAVTINPTTTPVEAGTPITGNMGEVVTNSSSSLTQQVIYKELDTETDRNTITIGTMELREGRVRGVWRKLGALLKSPTDRNNSNGIATQQPL